jgi:hypothetical protein
MTYSLLNEFVKSHGERRSTFPLCFINRRSACILKFYKIIYLLSIFLSHRSTLHKNLLLSHLAEMSLYESKLESLFTSNRRSRNQSVPVLDETISDVFDSTITELPLDFSNVSLYEKSSTAAVPTTSKNINNYSSTRLSVLLNITNINETFNNWSTSGPSDEAFETEASDLPAYDNETNYTTTGNTPIIPITVDSLPPFTLDLFLFPIFFVSFLSLIINTFSIHLILNDFNLSIRKHPTNSTILSLSLSNILGLIFVGIISVIPNKVCSLQAFMDTFFSTVSLLSLCLICIDRVWVSLKKFFRFKTYKRKYRARHAYD